jgi:ABC-type multidrug transport system ATPase subunit
MTAAIEARGLVRHFGSVPAVDGIDLYVPRGSVYGFLGPNGSGKTTTIRLLLGLLRPDRGSISLLGGSPHDDSSLAQVGAIVERPAFYPYLSAHENLRLFATLARMPSAEGSAAADRALGIVGLSSVARRKVDGFSTGMKQRLAMALALLRDPTLVILDEPTNGLDPGGVVEVRGVIGELARSGRTVFLSTHVLTEVEQLCDRVAVLQRGRLVAEGLTKELLERGRRLAITFDTQEEAGGAARVLAAAGLASEPASDGDYTLLVTADRLGSSAVSRLLAGQGLYPAELVIRRASLESVFLQLTDGV